MAKLSARGRTAQVEISREYTSDQLQAAHDKAYPAGDTFHGPSLTSWERVTRRLMSDGKVLEKRDVRFRPSTFEPNGRLHSYGWKVSATLKAGKTADDYAAIYSGPRKSGAPSPWTVTRHGIGKTVVISQARIQRAIESGESVGFCLNCGSERDGCEPDARNYPCDSCGQMAVYGAEECLIGA